MSEEIFVNTGTSFQQPYIARQPAIGTAPAIGTVPARTPTIVQTPFTYSNRTPFTYQASRNAQTPYIAAAQQPYPYIASNQTPYIASAQQPYPYIAQARQPNIYQHRTPSTYTNANVNYQTPFTYQARQPSTYTNANVSYQTPFTYQATGRSPFTYSARQPFTYQATGRSPSIGQARQPSITTTSQTITETNINNSVTGESYVTKSGTQSFMFSVVDHYVKFVFSNGTTNISTVDYNNGVRSTARKISVYMKCAGAGGSGISFQAVPSGMNASYLLMGEWETPSGFAPDSYAIELTSSSASSSFGATSRIWDQTTDATYTTSKTWLDANQGLIWGYTSSGFAYSTRVATECTDSYNVFTENFAIEFRKSGYPNLVVDTFHFETEHNNNFTGNPSNCF